MLTLMEGKAPLIYPAGNVLTLDLALDEISPGVSGGWLSHLPAWLTHLRNIGATSEHISQIGSFPQVGVKSKNI